MNRKFFILVLSVICLFGQSKTEPEESDTLRYIFEPDSLTLNVGETGTVTIKLVDPEGNIFHKTIGLVTTELMEKKFKPFLM